MSSAPRATRGGAAAAFLVSWTRGRCSGTPGLRPAHTDAPSLTPCIPFSADSHPDWPWQRLRRETPSRYEAYVDLVPGAWTRVRIVVRGDTARLYVHGQPQPTLVVGDVKSGAGARGAVALWIGPGTVAHFRDVRITAGSPR